MSVQLYYQLTGTAAPFVYGQAAGIYAKYGLAPTFQFATSGADANQVVASGRADIGVTLAPGLIQLAGKGEDLVAVMQVAGVDPSGVIVRQDSGIASPADLKGKTIASVSGTPLTAQLIAYLGRYGLSKSDVVIQQLGAPAANAAFIAGQVDAIVKSVPVVVPLFESKGIKVRSFLFGSDGGIYSVVAVKQSYLSSSKEIVRSFISATREAIERSRKDPTAAAQALTDKYGSAAPAVSVSVEALKQYDPYYTTPRNSGHPFGWIDSTDWSNTLAAAKSFYGAEPPSRVLYTNELVG